MARNYSARVHITLPAALLRQLEIAAKRTYSLRSDIMRLALLDWLAAHPTLASDPEGTVKTIAAGQLTVPEKPKRKFPPPDEVAFKDLLTPDMTSEEMLELLLEYEKQYPGN